MLFFQMQNKHFKTKHALSYLRELFSVVVDIQIGFLCEQAVSYEGEVDSFIRIMYCWPASAV